MLKKLLCLLLAATFLAVLPALSGCEDKSDRISVERKTKVENVPAGERIKTTGD